MEDLTKEEVEVEEVKVELMMEELVADECEGTAAEKLRKSTELITVGKRKITHDTTMKNYATSLAKRQIPLQGRKEGGSYRGIRLPAGKPENPCPSLPVHGRSLGNPGMLEIHKKNQKTELFVMMWRV